MTKSLMKSKKIDLLNLSIERDKISVSIGSPMSRVTLPSYAYYLVVTEATFNFDAGGLSTT